MGKFIQISGLVYEKRKHGQNDPNKINTEEGYTIIINSDYIHNIREIRFSDSKNRNYMRYQISTIANNIISGHYISKADYDSLVSTISTDIDFGLITIS